jgi:hypothetical protein
MSTALSTVSGLYALIDRLAAIASVTVIIFSSNKLFTEPFPIPLIRFFHNTDYTHGRIFAIPGDENNISNIA